MASHPRAYGKETYGAVWSRRRRLSALLTGLAFVVPYVPTLLHFPRLNVLRDEQNPCTAMSLALVLIALGLSLGEGRSRRVSLWNVLLGVGWVVAVICIPV